MTLHRPMTPLTKDDMRADIAQVLDVAPETIADGDSLLDHGLDSLRAMDLVTRWEARVPHLDYIDFFEVETLDEWWAVVERTRRA
ncbi:phosphopantetheine-binding protein [Salipiger abyssi]|uniref:phosphopantetheine-binding protein n=1 Tax=Salipiger abyssi TaxID=1250539 RepID=UPI0040599CE4